MSEQGHPYGQCQLVDEYGAQCPDPVPAPPTDEDGRRRGGRKGKYCSKAHADKASRLQRATAAAVTGEGVRRALEMAERLLPTLQEQHTAIGSLRTLLEGIETGALSRVDAADADADAARREATLADIRATDAELRATDAEQQAKTATATAQAAVEAHTRAEHERHNAIAREDSAVARAGAAEARAGVAAVNEREAQQRIIELTGTLAATRENLVATEQSRNNAQADLATTREHLDAQRRTAEHLTVDNTRLSAELKASRRELANLTKQLDLANRETVAANAAAEEAETRADIAGMDAAQARIDRTASILAQQQLTERLEAELAQLRSATAELLERAVSAELRLMRPEVAE